MAFASSRVMGTCAVIGQAAGTAAALAIRKGILPRAMGEHIRELQQMLIKNDCYLPGILGDDPKDLLRDAQISASHYTCDPTVIWNGITRPVGDTPNCWQASAASGDWITLSTIQPKNIREVHLYFDSNLSQELMMSLSEEILAMQERTSPDTLVKSFRLEFYKVDSLVHTEVCKTKGQRRVVIKLADAVKCDRVKVTIEIHK